VKVYVSYPKYDFHIVEPTKLGRRNHINAEGEIIGNLTHIDGPKIANNKSIKGYDLFFATGGWTLGWRHEYSNLDIPKILYWHNIPLTPDKVDANKVAIVYESFKAQSSSSVSGFKANLCRDPNYWDEWIGNKNKALVVAHAYSTYKAKYHFRGILIKENPLINLISKIHRICRNRPRKITHKEKCGSEWWDMMLKKGFPINIHERYIPTEKYRQILREHKVFLMFGKWKDMNGGFVSASMVGMPLVVSNHPDYNIMMKHEIDGFLVDTPLEAINYCQRLFEDEDLAKKYSRRARKFAMREFSPEACKPAYDKAIADAFDKYEKDD